jgi:hypothetical protein
MILGSFFINYIFLIIFALSFFLVIYFYYKKYYIISRLKLIEHRIEKRRFIVSRFVLKHIVFISIIFCILYCIFLYLIFFKISNWYNSSEEDNFNYKLNNIENIKNYTSLDTYFSDNKAKTIQPVNIIIVTNKDISKLLNNLWRIKNETFVDNNIRLRDFYSLYMKKELPVSNLYVNWKAQNMAFQMKSDSNFNRIHLRVWDFWKIGEKSIYLISISKDTSLNLTMYNNFLTPIHKIDSNVDFQREFFIKQIITKYPYIKYKKENLFYFNKKLNKLNFKTDWDVYIINY